MKIIDSQKRVEVHMWMRYLKELMVQCLRRSYDIYVHLTMYCILRHLQVTLN